VRKNSTVFFWLGKVIRNRSDEILRSVVTLRAGMLATAITSTERLKKRFKNVWWLLLVNKVMSRIYYTLLPICDWAGNLKTITSVLYWFCLTIKFTREISTQKKKIEIHKLQVRLWNFFYTLCNAFISISGYKFCSEQRKICKALKLSVKSALHLNRHPRPAIKRNLPSWCWKTLMTRI
jgi:hypothetical protein